MRQKITELLGSDLQAFDSADALRYCAGTAPVLISSSKPCFVELRRATLAGQHWLNILWKM